MAPEELLDALAVAQGFRHLVEPGLDEPDLRRVVDGNLDVEMTGPNSFETSSHALQGVGHGAGGDEDGEPAKSEPGQCEQEVALRPVPVSQGSEDDGEKGHARAECP